MTDYKSGGKKSEPYPLGLISVPIIDPLKPDYTTPKEKEGTHEENEE